MAETAEESSKENYCNGWPPGGRKFSEADREFPATREATEKENYRGGRQRQGRLAELFREIPRASATSATLSLPVLKDACFCSPPARHGRGVFSGGSACTRKTPAAAESAGGRVQRQAETFDSQNSIATQA